MPEIVTNKSRQTSAVSRIGLGIVILAGLLLGLLISAATLYLDLFFTFASGPSPGTVVVVGVLIVFFAGLPAFVLLRSPTRHVRRLGVGLSSGAGIALVALVAGGASTGFDPSRMTQGEIDHKVRKITSANREAYYLGNEADGKRLAAITGLDGLLFFGYGRCLDNVEGDCDRPLEVTSQPTRTFGNRGETAQDCTRLRPILGVPSATLNGDPTIFTGSSIVTITYYKKRGSTLFSQFKPAAALLNQLRAVGTATVAQALPPPDRATRAFLDRHCGPAVN
jgi:hypothetical protein